MKLNQRTFENILIYGLVAASMFEPWSAAVGILAVFAHQAADKYFTRNISDKDREEIAEIKAQIKKHSEILQKEGLSKAFGGQRG